MIKNGWPMYRRRNLADFSHSHTYTSLRHQADRHPQPFPISSFPYTAPFPVRSTSPPQLFLCMQRLTRMRLVCLGVCIVSFPEPKKAPLGPRNRRPSRGAFTLLGPGWPRPGRGTRSESPRPASTVRERLGLGLEERERALLGNNVHDGGIQGSAGDRPRIPYVGGLRVGDEPRERERERKRERERLY